MFAEGLSFGIQATWQAGKLLLKRSCPSFRQLALLAVLLWVLTSEATFCASRTPPFGASAAVALICPPSILVHHVVFKPIPNFDQPCKKQSYFPAVMQPARLTCERVSAELTVFAQPHTVMLTALTISYIFMHRLTCKLGLFRHVTSFQQECLSSDKPIHAAGLRDKRTAPHPYSRLSSPMRPMSAMDWHIALHEHGIAGVKAKHLQYQTKTRHLAGNRTETHHVKADCKRPVSITCTAHPTDSNTHREAPQMRQRLHTESEAMAPPSTVADSQDVAVQTISAQVLPYKVCKCIFPKQHFCCTQLQGCASHILMSMTLVMHELHQLSVIMCTFPATCRLCKPIMTDPVLHASICNASPHADVTVLCTKSQSVLCPFADCCIGRVWPSCISQEKQNGAECVP